MTKTILLQAIENISLEFFHTIPNINTEFRLWIIN